MSGPAPKPAHLRQRTNKKAGATTLGPTVTTDDEVPAIPNPDGRTWHRLTLDAWKDAWKSPMSSQWLESDIDGLGQLALLWDELYKADNLTAMVKAMAEIRLQRQCFGLTPLDRSRLQWEVKRGEDAERKRAPAPPSRTGDDPRKVLRMVAG